MRATLNTYALEARCEFLTRLRLPAYALPTLGFPIMFYVFFGIAMGTRHAGSGVGVALYLLASFGAFGVVGASLFGFGVSVAMERAQGWLTLKRATPMPPLAYLLAKVASAILFSLAIAIGLMICAVAFGGVAFDAPSFASLLAVLAVGAIPFCALGLAVGTLAGPNSAVPIANILNLSLAFLGGLWIPIAALPTNLRGVAQWLPTYHFGELALATIGAGEGSNLVHVAVLVAYGIAGLALAAYGWRRDEGKLYG